MRVSQAKLVKACWTATAILLLLVAFHIHMSNIKRAALKEFMIFRDDFRWQSESEEARSYYHARYKLRQPRLMKVNSDEAMTMFGYTNFAGFVWLVELDPKNDWFKQTVCWRGLASGQRADATSFSLRRIHT